MFMDSDLPLNDNSRSWQKRRQKVNPRVFSYVKAVGRKVQSGKVVVMTAENGIRFKKRLS